MSLTTRGSLLSLAVLAAFAHVLPVRAETAAAAAGGSASFCLYELPPNEDGKRRWLNLGIVQYIELNRNELRLYYGGGNFGGGYEVRLPLASPAQAEETLDRLRQAAAACK